MGNDKKNMELNLVGTHPLTSVLFRCKDYECQHVCCDQNAVKLFAKPNVNIGCFHFILIGDSGAFDPLYNRWLQGTSKLDLIRELKAKWEKK